MQLRSMMQQDLRSGGYSEKTVAAYLFAQEKYAAFLGRSPLTAKQEDLRRYRTWLDEQGYASGTLKICIAGVKYLYSTTLGSPELVAFMGYPRHKTVLPTVLSVEQIRKIFAAIEHPTCLCLYKLLYATGLRINEAIRLDVTDILADRKCILVRAAKGGGQRQVLLSEKLLAELRSYWKQVRPNKPILFADQSGAQRLSATTARKVLHAAVKKCGIELRVTPHVFRHSFATHLLDADVDIVKIKTLLGHRSISTTTRYLRVSNALVASVVSPFDRL